MANDIIDITVTDNSDNVQINATPNLVTINVSNTSGNIIGSNYYLVSGYAALPVVGDLTTLYITNDTSLMYRWNGSAYIQVNSVTSVFLPVLGSVKTIPGRNTPVPCAGYDLPPPTEGAA